MNRTTHSVLGPPTYINLKKKKKKVLHKPGLMGHFLKRGPYFPGDFSLYQIAKTKPNKNKPSLAHTESEGQVDLTERSSPAPVASGLVGQQHPETALAPPVLHKIQSAFHFTWPRPRLHADSPG